MTDDEEAGAAEAAEDAELAETIAELRENLQEVTGRDIPLLKAAVRGIVASEIESIQELPAAGRAVGERLDELDQRVTSLEERVDTLRSIDGGQSSKAEKFAAVLAYAENKATGQRSKVAVSAQEAKGCAGVSRRYAYDLLDAMADEIQGVRLREAQRVETGSGVEHKQKALLVDCEEVHSDQRRVKQFTTASGREGGENALD